MLEVYFESPFTLNTLRNGPCGAWLDGFAAALQEHGYTWWTGRLSLVKTHLGLSEPAQRGISERERR